MSYGGYETTYTSYGGGGGAGGGGFIPGDGSQTSPRAQRDFSQESLRPVTIKQILDAQEANNEIFNLDGSQITQLTFVGQIRNVSTQTTNVTYKLDDGTGSIEAKLWIDSDAVEQSDPTKEKLVENAYCRVWGKLKAFGNKRYINALTVRPIEDYNEISYHLLEATVVHLHFTKGPPGGAQSGAVANGGYGQQQQTGGAYDISGSLNAMNLSSEAKKVYEVLRTAEQSNEGLHQQDIAARLKMDTGTIAQAGDDLLSMGLIYTTVDDSTWAILETD